MIEVDRLSKRFGDFSAVEDTSLTVREGEVFAFLEAFPYSGARFVSPYDPRIVKRIAA